MKKLHTTTFGGTLALLAATLSSQSAVAAPLTVPIASCPGAKAVGFVGDYPRDIAGFAAPGAMRQFLGIPYARAPVGANRWQPPKPGCWTGGRRFTEFGNFCAQNTAGPGGSENCLFLNIFAPPTGTYSKLPVMVWIHDGSFIAGKGSFWAHNPIDFIRQDVIVVTFNYRLGALGFLAHPALDNVNTGNTGNYSFMDQQEVLRWVKRNIAGFGGNPNNVTIFGSSAGGISTLVHLVSPPSKGLFHKAIVQSGSLYQRPFPLREAEQWGLKFGRVVGCTTAACLRKVPLKTLLQHQLIIARGDIESLRIDGIILKDSVANLLKRGQFHKNVPVINGNNHDEAGNINEDQFIGDGNRCGYTSNIVPNGMANFPGARTFHEVLIKFFGQTNRFPPLVEPLYPAGNSGTTATAAYIAMRTDFNRACRTIKVDNFLRNGGAKAVYGYEFNDPNAPMYMFGPFKHHDGTRLNLKSSLVAEMQYLFRMPQEGMCQRPYPGLKPPQRQLSVAMVKYWTTFAKTGNPNPTSGPALPNWPEFGGENSQIMSFQPPTPVVKSVADFRLDHKCAFWDPNVE